MKCSVNPLLPYHIGEGGAVKLRQGLSAQAAAETRDSEQASGQVWKLSASKNLITRRKKKCEVERRKEKGICAKRGKVKGNSARRPNRRRHKPRRHRTPLSRVKSHCQPPTTSWWLGVGYVDNNPHPPRECDQKRTTLVSLFR